MIKVGLTGGIGSGKTVIAKIFSSLQVPIYDSDSRAKYLMNTNEEVKKKITELIGDNAYKNSELQKNIIANAIFSNNDIKTKLQDIVHPCVRKDFLDWAILQKSPYVIMESALIFDTDLYTYFDFIIMVTSTMQNRIERIKKRDNILEEEIIKRIKMQPQEEICRLKSHFVVENNNTFVMSQVIEIHNKICNKLERVNG